MRSPASSPRQHPRVYLKVCARSHRFLVACASCTPSPSRRLEAALTAIESSALAPTQKTRLIELCKTEQLTNTLYGSTDSGAHHPSRATFDDARSSFGRLLASARDESRCRALNRLGARVHRATSPFPDSAFSIRRYQPRRNSECFPLTPYKRTASAGASSKASVCSAQGAFHLRSSHSLRVL
jgi:hypothetical protein